MGVKIEHMTNTHAAVDLPVSMPPQEAAELLTAEAPSKTAEQWFLWLRNNRIPSRPAAWRMPFIKIGANVLYDTEDLQRLARIENVRVGKAKITPEDGIWLKSLSTKDKPKA